MYILTAHRKEFLPFYRERAINVTIHGGDYYAVLLNPAEYAMLLLKLNVTKFYVKDNEKGIFIQSNGDAVYEYSAYYNTVTDKIKNLYNL